MKNAALLLGIWVGIYIIACSVVELQSVEATHVERPAATEVVDNIRGFALTLPSGWRMVTTDGAPRLEAPIAGIEMWAVSVAETTVDDALEAAWETVEPCSSCSRPNVQRSDPLPWGRDGATVRFAQDEEGRTSDAVILLWRDRARVLLIRLAPGLSLPARVASDVAEIRAGFRVAEPEPSLSEPESP